MDARLGQLEPKCLFKVVSIMRRSSRKCSVVTDHERLIVTLSQKDRALRGAWDILNGVLKGPTQAGEKWVIPKNNIAYYLKKLKEEGVCIEMEVNAPQPEESTPRRQEDVKGDPWDLYVQAYQWAGQEVSKGKLSSRKAASEVLKPVRTPVAIFVSLGVCIYVPASRHWLISHSPIHLT